MNNITKKILDRFLKEEAPTNAMGTSSSTSGTGPIDTFDPILSLKKKIMARGKPQVISLKDKNSSKYTDSNS